MDNLPSTIPVIDVKVDIKKDQIQPNTGDSLQVKLTYTVDPMTLTLPDGSELISTTKVFTTTLGDMKAYSIACASQIATIQTNKAIADALIQPVTDSVAAAIAAIQ